MKSPSKPQNQKDQSEHFQGGRETRSLNPTGRSEIPGNFCYGETQGKWRHVSTENMYTNASWQHDAREVERSRFHGLKNGLTKHGVFVRSILCGNKEPGSANTSCNTGIP